MKREETTSTIFKMPCARYLAWTVLFEAFQQIHPHKLVAEKDWQALSLLIDALRESRHLDEWAEIARMSDAIEGAHRISTPAAWHKLYDALDQLWADEHMNEKAWKN